MTAFVLASLGSLVLSQLDPFAGSGCNCSAFCAGRCAINATKPQNITLYRMTMEGVYGMANKDTGDVLGDTSFVVSKRVTAYQCRTSNKGSPLCLDVAQFSGDDANSTDLVAAFTVEVDGMYKPTKIYCFHTKPNGK
jgi:hypothetical protein